MMRLVAVVYLALYVHVGHAALVHHKDSFHKDNLNHESSSATFLVNQKETSGLEDAKAMQLSDSIQGLFDASTLSADSMQASPAMASSKTVAKPSAQKAVMKLQSQKAEKSIEHLAAKPPVKKVSVKLQSQQVEAGIEHVVSRKKNAAQKDTSKTSLKLQSQQAEAGIEHAVSKKKDVAQKDTSKKTAVAPKVLATRMQTMVAQARQQETQRITKASKEKVETQVSGVVQKLKAFVTKAHQRQEQVGQKPVSKVPEVKHAAVGKKVSKLVAEKTSVVHAKQVASMKAPEVLHEKNIASNPAKIAKQSKMLQPQHKTSPSVHVAMVPSKVEPQSQEHTLAVAPKFTPLAMKSLPMNLATVGPPKSVPNLAKIPVAGKPVHPGGPVPVTKLQVAEKARVGTDSEKNTNFTWFPFNHAASSTNASEHTLPSSSNASSANASEHTLLSSSNASDHSNASSSNTSDHSWFSPHSWFGFSPSSTSNASVLTNTSASVKSKNATLDNSTRDNKTKEIEKEKEVESLPFGSFAIGLDEPSQPQNQSAPQNKSTPPVLNATARAALKAAQVKKAAEKAAWQEREKVLREEITLLKARLENDTMEIKKHHLEDEQSPPAAGTFNSQADATTAPPLDDVAEVKKPEPMEPLIKDQKPKADWPSMKSIAAPVTLHHVNSSEVPPQKEAMEAQAGDSAKVGLNTAFTGTPTKKVQSVIALDATVQHDAVFTDDSSAPAENTTPAPFSLLNWVSSFFSRMFWGTPETAAQHVETAVQHVEHVAAPKKAVTALLDTTQRRVGPRDYDKIAQDTQAEANHIIAPTSVWGDLEAEDRKEEDVVRGEDQSERMRAETPQTVRAESKEELQGRHGTDMSRFWSNLEKEDGEIEKSVANENLGEYERLTQDQEQKVNKADNQLQESKLHTDREQVLKHNDNSFLARTIHEPWAVLEQKDKVLEEKIHAAPELQMLQLKDSLRDLHPPSHA
jgi:hypothetical protein